jgi:epoxyqueuosine reductase
MMGRLHDRTTRRPTSATVDPLLTLRKTNGSDMLSGVSRSPPPMDLPPPPVDPRPRDLIVAEAKRLGFEAVGFARADVPLEHDFERYEVFIAAEKHGEMTWLASLPEARRRLDGEHILPGARTVICLARRYARTASDEEADAPMAQGIARYARGRDYHNGMRKKLRKLAALTRRLGDDVRARPLCDEEPVLERAWAARAGLGFVGKNGLLIVPGVGSFVLLGEVVTTLAIEPDPPIAERCGSCTRCLDACPTSAFDAPFVLDPRRCVAYLTIEHRGAIDESLRAGVGAHLFGCDDCQTVCPFNAARGRRATSEVDVRFTADPRWASTEMIDLLSLDDEGFVRLREGSPIGRATRAGLARNAAIILGNRSEAAAVPALERARTDHDSVVVREAAGWALDQIRRPDRSVG